MQQMKTGKCSKNICSILTVFGFQQKSTVSVTIFCHLYRDTEHEVQPGRLHKDFPGRVSPPSRFGNSTNTKKFCQKSSSSREGLILALFPFMQTNH